MMDGYSVQQASLLSMNGLEILSAIQKVLTLGMMMIMDKICTEVDKEFALR